MASKPETVTYILDQLAGAGSVSAKKMFGEYGIYLFDRMFALVCDDMLFFKLCAASEKFYPDAPMASPYPGAKPCVHIPEERWDDHEWLSQFAMATAKAMPLPKKKVKKA